MAQELTPISSLTTEQLIEREDLLSKYGGHDRIVDSTSKRKEHSGMPRISHSFATGLSRIDQAIGNLQTGELITIGGPTKNGKTLLAQTWTINLAAAGVHCLWFSFEVPERQFLQQMPESCEFYLPNELKFSNKNWLRDRILEGKLKFNTRVVFIDNLHHLVDFQMLRNISLDIGVVIRDLKRMAVELNAVVIILCHSKKSDNADGNPKEVSEWDLRDSSFIPQESDATIMVQRKCREKIYSAQAIVKICLHRRTGAMGQIVHVIKVGQLLEEDEAFYQGIPG